MAHHHPPRELVLQHTEKEINDAWDNVKAGKYGSTGIRPVINVDTPTEQVITIPSESGSEDFTYRRADASKPWEDARAPVPPTPSKS